MVRGLRKVRYVALWSALAYNLMHFGVTLLTEGAREEVEELSEP